METTLAIAIRKTKLTETSLIVTWLGESTGKIKTVAKGARQAKSRFGGVLDLFHNCEIQFARSRKSDLHVLREAVLREPFEQLRFDHLRLETCAYFAELIDLAIETDHPTPELYDLLMRALSHLNTTAASQRAVLHFESELVRLLGIQHHELAPIAALRRVYHHLPSSRQWLLQRLPVRQDLSGQASGTS